MPALIKLFAHVFHGEGLFNGTKLIVRTLLYRIKSLAKIKMITKSMKVKKLSIFHKQCSNFKFYLARFGTSCSQSENRTLRPTSRIEIST